MHIDALILNLLSSIECPHQLERVLQIRVVVLVRCGRSMCDWIALWTFGVGFECVLDVLLWSGCPMCSLW